MNEKDSPQLTEEDIARLARNQGKPAPKEMIDAVFSEIERRGIVPLPPTPKGKEVDLPPKINRSSPDL